uniref:Cyclin C-terminal domain-containing protein n=1 Tax=Brassica oleracea TaxID=3712 RepID=A0A3P6DSA5_BRAOL|nr:unnamed protein product [Brassica oleracea]
MEMKILEALNFYLVVFHPYRSLPEFLQDSGLNDTSMTYLTWGLVNDTYRDGPHPLSLYTHHISSRSLAFTLLLFTKRKT